MPVREPAISRTALLRSLAGCQGFVDGAAAGLGGVDILVNNAGASAFGAFVDLPDVI